MSDVALAPPDARRPRSASERQNREAALLVARRADRTLAHARVAELSRFVRAGDLLVVNTSATRPAALPARLEGRALELRLSTPAGAGDWVVELRTPDLDPVRPSPIGARLSLPEGATAELLTRSDGSDRLSVARLHLGVPLDAYLGRHGRPIRYAHDPTVRPIAAYQTVFARELGSAEMPSAARPFTAELVTELVSRGVLIAPVVLHTGVSSLERGEAPYAERYRVPATTARLVNAVHGFGGRTIAVGTSVVRALETVAAADGMLAPGAGTTDVVITPKRGLRAVDGLLTGWHEPDTSHLDLLEAAAGADLLAASYRAARTHRYRWHEFGDAHLIIP